MGQAGTTPGADAMQARGHRAGSRRARRRPAALAALVLALAPLRLVAQAAPDGHAEHHPQQAGQAGTAPPEAPTDAAPGMEGGDAMMRGMGAPPPKQLHPALMDLPDQSPEQRAEIERAAHERMTSGSALMADGLDRLVKATPANEYEAMQEAVALMREGLARFNSGLAAHRAIEQDAPPREVALRWFKTEMSLPAATTPAVRAGPWGLAWSHFLVMAMLTAFAAVMVTMYFFKMRRAATLLRRLTTPAPGAVVAPAPGPVPESRPATRPEQMAAPISLAPEPSSPERPEPPPGRWTGSLRVAAIFRETPSVKTFRLMNPSGGAIPFIFLPGQFLTVAVALAGSTVKRSYTIASSPAQRDYVEITVKREEMGAVSRYLHDRVQPGELLHVSPPQGRFTFTGAEANSIVLIGGGVGITPLMSIVRALTDRAWGGAIHLLYACRSTEEFVFRDELERLQRRHPNLQVVATMTRAEGTVWMGPRGRLSRDLVADCVPDLPGKRIHVCGPPPMMDAVRAMLLDLGVPSDHVLTEAFGPAEKTSSRRAAVEAAMVEAPTATTPTVTFTISGKSAALPRGTTVLEAAEHVGVSIDNSCRAGTCGTCAIRLVEGRVTMEVEDGLPADEKARGIILACQAKASSDLVVEA